VRRCNSPNGRHRHWWRRFAPGRFPGRDELSRHYRARHLGIGARRRQGSPRWRADRVAWVVADVTSWKPHRTYDLWHDRAAFHFLTEERDRAAYIARLTKSLKLGGYAIIATFAPEGPERCSGLPVMRYDAESLGLALGGAFELIETRRDEHLTPWGSKQRFQFSMFRRGYGST
jgi:hypothetical protein